MDNLDFHGAKNAICAVLGVIASGIAQVFGGWNSAMTTLLIFMAIDYITGMITAGIFHRSKKTKDGRLESRAGWKGLIRKGLTFVIVLVACRLDIIIGSTFIRDATVIAFIANETISIIENAGLMGMPIPKVITDAITVLKGRAHENENEMAKMAEAAKEKMKAAREEKKEKAKAKKEAKARAKKNKSKADVKFDSNLTEAEVENNFKNVNLGEETNEPNE